MKLSLAKRRMYLRYGAVALISALIGSSFSYIVIATGDSGDVVTQIRRIIEENAPTDSGALMTYNTQVANGLDDAAKILSQAANDVRKSASTGTGAAAPVTSGSITVGATCDTSTYRKGGGRDAINVGVNLTNGVKNIDKLFSATLNYGYAGGTFGLVGSSGVSVTKKNDSTFDIVASGSPRKIVLIGSISGGTPPKGSDGKPLPVYDTCIEVDIYPNSGVSNSYTPSITLPKSALSLSEGFMVKVSGLAPGVETGYPPGKIPQLSVLRDGATICVPSASRFCYPDSGYLAIDCRPTTTMTDASGKLEYYCSQDTSASARPGSGYKVKLESHTFTETWNNAITTYAASNAVSFTIGNGSGKRTDNCPSGQGLYTNPSSSRSSPPQCTSCQYIPKVERDLITNCDATVVDSQDIWNVTRNTTTDTFSPAPPNWPPADCSGTPVVGQACSKGSACKVGLGGGKYDIYTCFVPAQKEFYRGRLLLDDGTPIVGAKVNLTDRLPMGYGTWCNENYVTDSEGYWNKDGAFTANSCIRSSARIEVSFDGTVTGNIYTKYFSNPGDQGTQTVEKWSDLGVKCVKFDANNNFLIRYTRELFPAQDLARDDCTDYRAGPKKPNHPSCKGRNLSFQSYFSNGLTWWASAGNDKGAQHPPSKMAAWANAEKDYKGDVQKCPVAD